MKRRRTAAPGTGKRQLQSNKAPRLNPFIREDIPPQPTLLHGSLRTTRSGRLGATTTFEPLRNTDSVLDVMADLVSQETWEHFLNDDHEWLTDDEMLPEEARKENKRTAKRQHKLDYLAEYVRCRTALLDELLRLEHHGEDTATCATCNNATAPLHRCKDCCTVRLYCSSCIVIQHRHTPFHSIETWNGRYFQRSWLAELGLQIHLGHKGDKCMAPITAHRDFRILHVNGFHKVNISYCGCGFSGDPPLTQILRLRMFPTSFLQPRTAVTFECLNLFHSLTLQGKITVYDMYYTLVHVTDNRGLDPVLKSRYNECLQVLRVWRNLKMLKRAGRGNDKTGISGTKHGALAVECPACPHPGRNLPENWELDPESSQYLHALFVAVDANFRLKLKNRKLQDVELAPSWAYYVDREAYHEYTNAHADEVEINYCQSNLHAVDHANTASKSYAYNGVGACKCSRHGMIRPNGVGDLPKGEKYCSMDFILFSGISETRVPCVKISYDIACQWCKNLRSRMDQYPECIRHNETTQFVFGIPKFHLVGHGPGCQTKFSWNFLPGSARNHGESVEQDWPATNLVATSTREMSPAARRETLNDHWGWWNFRKVTGLGAFLERSYRTAVESRAAHAKRLEQFTKVFADELIGEWRDMIDAWNRDHSQPDPYVEDSATTLTFNSVKASLLKEEITEMQLGDLPGDANLISPSQFLLAGLELEEGQRLLMALKDKYGEEPSPTMRVTLQDKRNTLFRRIDSWRRLQERYMPIASPLLSSIPSATDLNVEDIPLLLPSALSDGQRTLYLALAEKEARLREAQADDALNELRNHLRVRHALYHYKKVHVRGQGQGPNTRARALLAQQTAKVDKCVLRYRAAFTALSALDANGSWKSRLLPLGSEHVRHPSDSDEMDGQERVGVQRLGEGHRTRSWIWIANPVDADGVPVRYDASDKEVDSSLRVEWTKSCARSQRWDEEVNLLASEMQRVMLFFEWKQGWWRDFKDDRDTVDSFISLGANAYAEEQAEGLDRMATACAGRWIPLLRAQGIEQSWFARYLQRLELSSSPASPASPAVPAPVPASTTPLHPDLTLTVPLTEDADSDGPEVSDAEDQPGEVQQPLEERVAALRLIAFDSYVDK